MSPGSYRLNRNKLLWRKEYELLPEEEFTLNEIEAFTISTENPETGDPIILYISGMFLCFSVALFAFYKLSKREKDYFL